MLGELYNPMVLYCCREHFDKTLLKYNNGKPGCMCSLAACAKDSNDIFKWDEDAIDMMIQIGLNDHVVCEMGCNYEDHDRNNLNFFNIGHRQLEKHQGGKS